jgi:hypothetical protein
MTSRWIGIAAVVALAAGAAWAKGGKAPPPPAKPAMLVEVTDTTGKPIAGAQVAVLDIEDGWTGWRRDLAVTDAKGIAAFTTSMNPLCLLAWTDTDAGIVGDQQLKKPPEKMSIAISAGSRVTGRIVGLDGKPARGARCRVRAHDPHEWHHFDADVAADGTIKLPTMPRELVEEDDAVLEYSADGKPVMSRRLADFADGKPVDLTFPPPRHVTGRLVGADGRPIVGGEVHTADWLNGPKTSADANGNFDFGPLKSDVDRVFVTSASHGDAAEAVPAGDGTISLGDVKLPVGKPLVVGFAETDGMKIRRAFLALATKEGFRVASVEGPGPSLTLPRVGDESYVLDLYVHDLEAACGWRRVRRADVRVDDGPVEIKVPMGLVVKLVDAAGKPFAADEVRVSCEIPNWKEPWAETFFGGHDERMKFAKFSEIRFGPMPASCAIDVTVTAKGFPSFVAKDVAIDADGCGAVTAKIAK